MSNFRGLGADYFKPHVSVDETRVWKCQLFWKALLFWKGMSWSICSIKAQVANKKPFNGFTDQLYAGMCVCMKVAVFLSAGEFPLRVQCQKKRCGTAAWKCCRIIYPASLNLLLARSLSVLPSWELPSNSFTKESRSNLRSRRTRSVSAQMHVIPQL